VVQTFETERGEVLLSVQLTLIREDQQAAQDSEQAGSHHDRIQAPSVARRMRPVDTTRPVGANVRRRAPWTMPHAPMLVDQGTGARTLVALRRDVALDGGATPALGERFALFALDVMPLSLIRSTLGNSAAERELQSLVEVTPFALGPGARVYRSGIDELALLLPFADVPAAEQARDRLSDAVERILAVRHLPSIQLMMRPMAVPSAAEAQALAAAVPLAAVV
jgi:GGDEF domain-containing protein